MIRFYKKGPLGMVKADAGMSDPDVSEVRMTIKEYRGLLDSVQSAEKSAENARVAAEDRINRIKEKAREEIEEVKQHAEAEADRRVEEARDVARKYFRKIESLKKQLEEANEISKNEKNLNKNLTRIMRERANQSRGIKPKKQHDGYIVLESRQWKEKYKVDVWDTEDHKRRYSGKLEEARRKRYFRTEKKTEKVWRSILQTPYDASIPLDLIQYRVEEEDLWEKGILKDIGCQGMCESYANGRHTYFGTCDDRSTKNGLYKWIFKANYRSGLWELEIYTTKALIVPEYRRPTQPQKTRKIKGKNRKQLDPKVKYTETNDDDGENPFKDLEVVDNLNDWEEEESRDYEW